MTKFNIQKPHQKNISQFQHIINTKTKPLGSLGMLEKIGLQLCMIQNSAKPTIINPQIFVFAADHGIAAEGVSPYPQEVTAQMVYNFMAGGAAINVFCNQNSINLTIIDAGVKHLDISKIPNNGHFISSSQGLGTENFLLKPAMSKTQFDNCIAIGAEIIQKNYTHTNSNVVGFGEMGIGNTSAAAMIMHYITKNKLELCIGRGTGLDNDGLSKKQSILLDAKLNFENNYPTVSPFYYFSGYEMAMICGGMLQAAHNKQTILVDGFIATAAFLMAHTTYPEIIEYAIFCHQSNENGHKLMLKYLKVEPILQLDMRLGEGTGCAMALPIVAASANFIANMASFEQAKVDNIH